MKHLLDTLPDGAKHAMDWAAVGGVVTTIAGWMPELAATVSFAWFVIRLHDRLRYGRHEAKD